MNPIAEQLAAKLVRDCGGMHPDPAVSARIYRDSEVRSMLAGLRDLLGDGVLRFGDDGEPEICDLREAGWMPDQRGIHLPRGGHAAVVFDSPGERGKYEQVFVVVPRAHQESEQ